MKRAITRFLALPYKILIKPRSANEDSRRRESILNVLLVGSFALTLMAFLVVFTNSLKAGFRGEPPLLAFALVIYILALLVASRKGLFHFSAYALVASFLLLALYLLYGWGILLPEGVLMLALVLTMSSVLLGTTWGAALTVASSVCLVAMGLLQQIGAIGINSSWMDRPGEVSDAVGFAFTLGVIMTVSWLSNREIERSLARAVASEADLKQERDSLEVKVKARTKELELAQREKIIELSRFAEFGRLTSNVIHELVTPLTTVALNLEQMDDEGHSERLRRAIESTNRMERYIESARKQLQHQSEFVVFSLGKEIRAAVEFLRPQADKAQVQIEFVQFDELELGGNPIKFHQMATNLVSNAVSAYSPDSGPGPRRVTLELRQVGEQAQLSVQDFGSGIPAQYIGKVFDPFFTLKKPDQGMGIGLSLVKEIAEHEFKGKIEVMSNKSNGTLFTVTVPLDQGTGARVN